MNKSSEVIMNIKFRYFFLVAIALSAVLLISANQKIEQRKKQKNKNDQFQKFDHIIQKRHLRDISLETQEICEKGDEKLIQYYNTSNASLIELPEGDFDKVDGQPEYIKNLIDIIGSEGDIMTFLTSYINRLIPVAIFLGGMILSIPGAIICCYCSCCKCCCSCCKKPNCKVPCLVITFIFSALAIACAIYGLGVSKSIFNGLASTECSILQFTNVITEGESKTDLPKWAGVNGLLKLMDDIVDKMDYTINKGPKQKFNDKKTERETAESNFNNAIKDETLSSFGTIPQIGSTNYVTNSVFRYFPSDAIDGTAAQLDTKTSKDICNNYQGPFVYCMKYEFEVMMDETNKYLDDAEKNFATASDVNFDEVVGPIKDSINSFTGGIEDIKDLVADLLINYSGIIDHYGRLSFTILFSVIAAIEAALVIFSVLFFICRGCKCCGCLIGCGINLFWIILSFLMIIVFLFSFLFTFIGTIGEDLFTTINCILGPANVKSPEPIPSFIGDVAQYFIPCLYDDSTGDLAGALGIDLTGDSSGMGALNELKTLTDQIDQAQQRLSSLKFMSAENYIEGTLNQIVQGNENVIVSFYDKTSPSTTPKYFVDVPPEEKSTYKNGAAEQAEKLIEHMQQTNGIMDKYKAVIEQDKKTLQTYKEVITDISSVFNEVSGNGGGAFDLLNCKFMGINLRIMIKYLGDALGKGFKTTGIVLGVSAFGMGLVISSVILAKASLKNDIDEQNEKAEQNQNAKNQQGEQGYDSGSKTPYQPGMVQHDQTNDPAISVYSRKNGQKLSSKQSKKPSKRLKKY